MYETRVPHQSVSGTNDAEDYHLVSDLTVKISAKSPAMYYLVSEKSRFISYFGLSMLISLLYLLKM